MRFYIFAVALILGPLSVFAGEDCDNNPGAKKQSKVIKELTDKISGDPYVYHFDLKCKYGDEADKLKLCKILDQAHLALKNLRKEQIAADDKGQELMNSGQIEAGREMLAKANAIKEQMKPYQTFVHDTSIQLKLKDKVVALPLYEDSISTTEEAVPQNMEDLQNCITDYSKLKVQTIQAIVVMCEAII